MEGNEGLSRGSIDDAVTMGERSRSEKWNEVF